MKKVIIVIIFSLGMVSCKKFLAESSQSDVIPRKTSDFGEILYTNGYPLKSMYLQPYLHLMDDDVECYLKEVNLDSKGAIASVAAPFQWQPDFIDLSKLNGDGMVSNYNSWQTYYKLILGTNVALQYMDNSVGGVEEKNIYKGEAYALRAFYHFMLVNLYAKPYNDSTTTPDKSRGVPIITSSSLSEELPEASSVKEVYDRITSDLDSACILLESLRPQTKPYRMSAVAAHLLASRVYLYMEQWDKVISHADYVLKYHPQLMDLNGWGDTDPISKPVIGFGNVETLWYYGRLEESVYPGGYNISNGLVACFTPEDLRSQVYFYPVPDFLREYVATDNMTQKMYESGVISTYVMGTAWRSAEAYLNRAEACIQRFRVTGNVANAHEALNNLNTLRRNRIDRSSFVNWELAPADSLLQLCRTERRRELFNEEGHRWFDLRRYGMPSIRHLYRPELYVTKVYKLTDKDPQYVLPIPREVLERNPSLQQSTQLPALRQPE